MTEIQRWADAAQYRSEPMPQAAQAGITVTLLNATPDPLGQVAALCAMYEGRVIRNYRELTDGERLQAFADMRATVLNGPLASPHFHFLVEGAGRDFTHQAVRDSYSFIAQESLRFAVKEDWAAEVPLPPSLVGLPDDHPHVRLWRKALNGAEDAYAALVNAGMPAEDARKLLPHAVTTRYHWTPSLKTLLTEAGKRTCTQAQFEWRQFFGQVAKALREHVGEDYWASEPQLVPGYVNRPSRWQYELIAEALRPNCFQTGSCGFMAKFDRGCTIRDRVEANARIQRPSSEWHLPHEVTRCGADSDCPGGCEMEETKTLIKPIQPWEWAGDPTAARTTVQEGEGK